MAWTQGIRVHHAHDEGHGAAGQLDFLLKPDRLKSVMRGRPISGSTFCQGIGSTAAALLGWAVVAEYIEPGASETDDKGPEFQRMIERA
jgi:hypothetical protein